MTVKRKKSGKDRLLAKLRKFSQQAVNNASLRLKEIARQTVSRKYIPARKDARIAANVRRRAQRIASNATQENSVSETQS